MFRSGWLLLLLFCMAIGHTATCQITIKGTVVEAHNQKALPYVNIGILHKSTGTITHPDGTFSISIPEQYKNDTLTFSMVGYTSLSIPVSGMNSAGAQYELKEKRSQLKTVTIVGEKVTEEKIGIVKYHPLVHFNDGSTNQDDIFEIAQLIKFSDKPSKITSLNLYISEDRKDSGIFRINFYSFDGKRPGNRVFERSIMQTHAINKGWLTFDLKPYDVYLKGDFVAAIEFIPSIQKTSPIYYEVKLGGSAKSFSRPRSQADWRIPPHHYRMYVTAMVAKGWQSRKDNGDKDETLPAARLFSAVVQDSFSIFIKVPHDYYKHPQDHYPVVYLLDANAYFDQVSDYITNELRTAPILVGVGYADFLQNDSLRNRDYTYPVALAEDSFPVSGGGDKFLRFLKKELIPYIDSNYRVDTKNRTIMGHSLGGYFTMFAMEREMIEGKQIFKNFVAASPSLHYRNGYLLEQLREITRTIPPRPLTLYVTAGSRESDRGGMPTGLNDFIQHLQTQKVGGITVRSEMYKDFSHMETAVKTFEDALEWLMRSK